MDIKDWFYETDIPLTAAIKVKEHLYSAQSKYQRIDVLDTYALGKLLLLDKMVMTSEKDEFYYHESITHPILSTHTNPKKVMIIGGGDGGTAREVLKYPSIEEVDMVEIDEEVVNVSKKYFPSITCELENPKLNVRIEDAFEFANNAQDAFYDIVICDCTDPSPDGIAAMLISKDFYKNIKRILKDDGIYIAQSGSPFLQENEFNTCIKNAKDIFKYTDNLISIIPTYPGSLWSFLIGSNKPINKTIKQNPQGKTKFWNKEIHDSLFAKPEWIKEKFYSPSKV